MSSESDTQPAPAVQPAESTQSATPAVPFEGFGAEQRLLLIDGHSMAFRAFFGLPAENFSNASGQHTNAVYGFLGMVFTLIKNERPTHLAVAFDLPGGTFRTEQYPDYKGGRDAFPEEFKGQIELIQEALDALGVAWTTYVNYEADDIIATLATRVGAAGAEVLVCSGDRDAFQLITEKVTVLYPRKGVSDLVRYTPEALFEKYAVYPRLYSDYAALVGESADNLPGVPGVGPKTAAKWLALYDDLAGVLSNRDAIKGKVGESLRDNVDNVLRNKEINQPVRDLEVGLDAATMGLGRGRESAIRAIFNKLDFRSIRQRVPNELLSPDDEGVDETPEGGGAGLVSEADLLAGQQVFASDTAGLAEWLREHARADSNLGGVAVHIEGEWNLGVGTVHAIALASGSSTAYIDPTALTPEADAALGIWLRNASVKKIMHDAKLTSHLLRSLGYTVRGVAFDLPLAEYLVRPDSKHFDLTYLADQLLGRVLDAAASVGQLALDVEGEANPNAAFEAAQLRAAAIRDLMPPLRDQLVEHESLALLTNLELPVQHVLVEVESGGIAVDRGVLSALDSQFAGAADEARRAAHAVIDDDTVNLGSPKQLQEVLFTRLGLKPLRKTKTGFSTDADTLNELFASTGNEFLQHLLVHRDVTKLKQIVETVTKGVGDDGRIHTTFQQTAAATGRLSSFNPNLQNIPARSADGRRIRGAFVAGEGFESLMTADYSQIEMRIMAHLSQDAGLIEAFNSGEDLHNYVASRVFGVDPDSVDGAMRSKTKAVSYGLAYGLSTFGLAKQLSIANDEAGKLRDDYFSRFGGVRDYLRRVVEEARERGYTQTIQGRRRYLPDLTSDQRLKRENAERIALNSPIQGSAADLIKIAMINTQAALREASLRSRMVLQVHDELVFEVAPGERDELEEIVRHEMGHAFELSVPLDVSVGVGESWQAAAH
ncbi:DNA polymerase I [Micrococcales bacterium 31B]|nr:DNA polymerase I [Micrococcales bacterium 31B]